MTRSDVELDPTVEEPPMLAFVRDYWWRQRGALAMPRRKDISPSDMKPHLPHVLLADVVDGGNDFRYRLVGAELQRAFASNPTGKLMSEALAGFGADTVKTTLQMYRTTIQRGEPLRVRASGRYFSQNAKFVDALITPLADDGANANMIFGTFTFIWNENMQLALSRGPGETDFGRALQADSHR